MAARLFGFCSERRGPLAAICFHRRPRKTRRWIQEGEQHLPVMWWETASRVVRAGGGGPGARAGLGPVLPRSDTLSFPICSGTISRVPSGGTKMLLGGRGGGWWEWGWEGSTSPVTLTQARLAPGPQQSRLHYCSIIF